MLVIKEMVLSVIGVYTVLSVIGQCATCLPLVKKKATLKRGCQRREVSYSLSPSALGAVMEESLCRGSGRRQLWGQNSWVRNLVLGSVLPPSAQSS